MEFAGDQTVSAGENRYLTAMSTEEQLTEILTILKRIEERQIKTTNMVSEVKEHEAPVVGSFGTTESPESEKK